MRIVRPEINSRLSIAIRMLVCIVMLGLGSFTALAQKQYTTPEDALADLIAAAKGPGMGPLAAIFGEATKELISDDPVQQSAELNRFSEGIAEKAVLERSSAEKFTVIVGKGEWPFPVPIVKRADKWSFDLKAGLDELLSRRIGANELFTILTCQAYHAAQWEYFEADHDSDLVKEFAQRFISQPNMQDGLYWPTAKGAKPSPLGPTITAALGEGYKIAKVTNRKAPSTPYHGYYYRILTGQGPHAPGGKYSYVINGNMIGGFALIAYPVKWGSTGVMTFIVNQQGRVYQKNLGPNTNTLASALLSYDPDQSWKFVQH
jgi:hypothetical protein